jgi:hypothetical protein
LCLDTWRALHPLAYEAKRLLLQTLQPTVELQELAEGRSSTELAESWARSRALPSLGDPLTVWSRIRCVRSAALLTPERVPVSRTAASVLLSVGENTCFAALSSRILHIVKEELRHCEAFRRPDDSRLRETEIVVVYNQINIANKRFADKGAEVLRSYEKTREFIETKVKSATGAEAAELQLMYAKWIRLHGRCLRQHGFPMDQSLAAFKAHADLLRRTSAPKPALYENVACMAEEVLSAGNEVDARSLAQAAETFVSAVCAGLVVGQQYCRDKLLLMCTVAAKYQACAPLLESSLARTPPWVFLKYVAQLCSRLAGDEVSQCSRCFLFRSISK